MNKHALLAALAIVGPLAMPAAEAGLLYGHDRNGVLYGIDTGAQTTTPIGPITTRDQEPEIELSSDGSTIYMGAKSTGLDLYHIDPATGVTGTAVGPATGVNGSITAMEDIAGTLYAVDSNVGLGNMVLGTLDPITAVFSDIGPIQVPLPVTGLAYVDAILYAVTGSNGGFGALYSVDTGSGSASSIADITLSAAQVENITSLAWSAEDGKMYTTLSNGNNGALNATLYSLDLGTGALTQEFSLSDIIIIGLDAAVPVPAPAPIALLGLGLGALMLRRRLV